MTDAEAVPARKRMRRKVLILILAVVGLFAWGVFRMATYNPNYVKEVGRNRLILKSGEGVVLIGVECPPRQEPRVGKRAEEFLESLTLNRYVRIEQDEKKSDQADWMLGYVFTDDHGKEVFLNEELLRRGYGKLALSYPNLKYRKVLEAAEAEAREKNLGVWDPSYKPTEQ
jgi:endonuclease YncB( thermonuclease family)